MNINFIINNKVNGRMIKETDKDKGNPKNITLFIKIVYLFKLIYTNIIKKIINIIRWLMDQRC